MIMSQAKAVAAKQQADQQPRVAVVTTFGCPHCKAAKGALQAAGIAYEELELSGNLEALNTVKQLTGRATVPQVFVGGSLFGGASELLPKLEDGSFQELLASAPAEPLPSEIRQVVQQQSGPAAQGSTSPASPRASTEDQELAEELRRAGLARGAGNHTLILQAVVDWLASSRGLQAEAALQSLARLQSAQLLTVDLPPYSSSTAGHSRHGLAAVPLLGKLLAPAAAKAGLDWGSKDVPIDGALLQAQPEAGLRLVSEGGVPARLGRPLNAHYKWFGPARPAEAVAEDIRRALLQLYDRYTSSDGKKVNYTALRADPDWRRFVDATAELQKVDLFSLPREELMAFAINIYNALVVHALVEVGPATNALQRAKWYSGIRYVIGGFEFSSDEIEHGILRGNTPSPASLWSLVGKPEWAGRPFKQGDPRAQLAVRPVDPRIHFALNCGAASCPAIKVYSPENLDFGLAAAASAFCASEVEVYPERAELSLSMILKWYGGDFGSKRDLLGFLSQYLPPESKQQLEALMARAKDPAHDIKFSFRPYDWSTNSQ